MSNPDTKVKEVLALLNKDIYKPEMWEIALTMDCDELLLLHDYERQIAFIIKYVNERQEQNEED